MTVTPCHPLSSDAAEAAAKKAKREARAAKEAGDGNKSKGSLMDSLGVLKRSPKGAAWAHVGT